MSPLGGGISWDPETPSISTAEEPQMKYAQQPYFLPRRLGEHQIRYGFVRSLLVLFIVSIGIAHCNSLALFVPGAAYADATTSSPQMSLASTYNTGHTGLNSRIAEVRTCAVNRTRVCRSGLGQEKLAQGGACVCCFFNGCGCMAIAACYGSRGICRGPC